MNLPIFTSQFLFIPGLITVPVQVRYSTVPGTNTDDI